MFPPVERMPPLSLPVALLPPFWPGEALGCAVHLVILVTIRVVLSRWEGLVREHLHQLRAEELLQAPACLGYFRVRLEKRGGTLNTNQLNLHHS